jgi:hypothetical protein
VTVSLRRSPTRSVTESTASKHATPTLQPTTTAEATTTVATTTTRVPLLLSREVSTTEGWRYRIDVEPPIAAPAPAPAPGGCIATPPANQTNLSFLIPGPAGTPWVAIAFTSGRAGTHPVLLGPGLVTTLVTDNRGQPTTAGHAGSALAPRDPRKH